MNPNTRIKLLLEHRRTLNRARSTATSLRPKVKTVVPKLCPGGTVVCLASGPSLTRDDVEHVRDRVAAVIAVNDTYKYAPFATALLASDAGWWVVHQGVPSFGGLKYCLQAVPTNKCPGVLQLRDTGLEGIETDPTGLRTGRNSGAAAINLAVHFGAARIVLIGYDMQAVRGERYSHFFGHHPFPLRGNSDYMMFRRMYDGMVEPLRTLGVDVINCSRETALKAFPCRPLRDVLP